MVFNLQSCHEYSESGISEYVLAKFLIFIPIIFSLLALKFSQYLGRETVKEIPMANKERKIEALMVICERSGHTICLKLNFIVAL